MLYTVTFTINIPQMLAYIPYMDPMGLNPIKIPYFSCPGFDPIHPQAADSALSTALAEPRSELKALRADPGFPGGSRLSDHDPFGAGYIEV